MSGNPQPGLDFCKQCVGRRTMTHHRIFLLRDSQNDICLGPPASYLLKTVSRNRNKSIREHVAHAHADS
jgi:hypothetical protein